MRKIFCNSILISLFLISINSASAQYEATQHHAPNKTVDEINRLMDSTGLTSGIVKEDDYLRMYLGYKLNQSQFLKKGYESYFYDFFGPYCSFIGEYKEALETMDKRGSSIQNFTKEDSIEISLYHSVIAKDFLLKIADTCRIVIINEAHHIPQHRIFTTEVLKDLYDKGFRYFAAETIWNENNVVDSLFKNEKYPELRTGYYTQEPLYGDLIRQALKIGYKIVPYEKPIDSKKDREPEQAKYLAKVFEDDKTAKILIQCGYAHISKRWMAGYLEKLTGLYAFRIDQTLMMECSKEEFRNKYYQLADRKFNFTEPVFLSKGDDDYSFNSDGFADAVVFLPKTKYINERPDWMSMDGYRKPYPIKLDEKTQDENILIQAFFEDENSETAVPLDMVLTKKGIQEYTLMLPSGKFKIVYRKIGNIILEKNNIEVK